MRRGGAAGGVSAGIDDEVHVERGQFSIRLHADFGLEYRRVPGVLPKAVLRRGNEPHGSTDFARKKNRRMNRRDKNLGAEAATDVGNAQAHLVGLDAEEPGDLAGIAHGRARRQPEINLAIDILRQATADVLHRMMKHGWRYVGFLENPVRLPKAFLDVSPRQAVLQQEVRAAFFVENRRAGIKRFGCIKDRRERLILDANFFERPLGGTQVFGDHNGHEFTIEAHFINGDKVLIIAELQMLMMR